VGEEIDKMNQGAEAAATETFSPRAADWSTSRFSAQGAYAKVFWEKIKIHQIGDALGGPGGFSVSGVSVEGGQGTG